MSMSYGIYIGPFLRCERKSDERPDVWELTNERLCGLRGELCSDDGNVSYLGPNVDMPAITRQMRFGQYDESPVVMQIDQNAEIADFIDQFVVDIGKLRAEYKSVSVEWGIVPKFS